MVNHEENDVADVDSNEKTVFLAFFRRLSNPDFFSLLKLFALYSNSVISYFGKKTILFSFINKKNL